LNNLIFSFALINKEVVILLRLFKFCMKPTIILFRGNK